MSDVRNRFALTILAMALFAAAPAALADETICEGFDRKSRIYRLGGRAAFAKPTITSPGELKEGLEKHRAEIEQIMAERGLGHLTDALYTAAASGDGLSERNLERGEVLQWMAYRKRGKGVTHGPMCVAAKKSYGAYVIEVHEVEEMPAKAKCAVKASGGACADDKIMVDAGGSSDGVAVEMSGPGGAKKIISGGSTSWEGMAGPGKYTFTAKAEAQGSKKVTTHTFLIPKACLNLAYSGMETKEMAGETDSCSATADIEVADCAVSVDLSVDPAEVRRRESIQVNVSGTYDDVSVTFKDEDGNPVEARNADGNPISELSGSGAISFNKAGTYSLEASATRCNDLPEACRKTATAGPAEVDVRGRWIARFFGIRLDPDDGSIDQSRIRPDGLSERSVLKLASGVGAGAGLEYLFNERVGLEGSVIYVPLGSDFFFDIGVDWAADDDDVDMLAFLIGPNFHLTPDKKADFYIGPFVGIADLSSASYQVLGETQNRSLDADTVFGVQLGLDIPFGDGGWAVHLGARYFDMTVETDEEGPEIAADPLGVEVGFSYSF